MEKEVIIAIIGALAVVGGAVVQSGILNQVFDSEEGGGLVPPSVPSLEPDKTSPQEMETAIMWTASATDPDGGRLNYKFSVKSSSVNEWAVGKDWSNQNWWEWTPSEAGSYRVLVEVRDPEGNNNSMIKSYEIVEPVSEEENDDKVNEPPVLKSLEPDKTSPQEVGTAIKWTATAEDPDDTSLYYRFQLKGPYTDGYRVVQDRSTKDSWEWKPAEAGSYEVLVQVWDGDHAGPSESDDFRAVSYEIKETVADAEEAERVVPAFFSEEDPAVAASSWGEGRFDLFVIGTDGALYHRYGGGSSWSEWERLDGEWVSAPAAVSWGPGRIDVFAVGNDSALWHIWGDGSTWSDWESLGGNWTSAPTVSSAGENSMNVFIRGKDNALWHIWWDGSQSKWGSWESFGGYLTSAPAAISRGQGHIDVFARGKDNDLIHKSYVYPIWSEWELVDGSLNSAPTVSSPDEYTLDVYIRGKDNALYMNRWDGRQSKWGGWQTLGGKLTSAPAAVYSGSWRTDIFARGTNNTLVHKWWAAPKYDWSDFETIGKWP